MLGANGLYVGNGSVCGRGPAHTLEDVSHVGGLCVPPEAAGQLSRLELVHQVTQLRQRLKPFGGSPFGQRWRQTIAPRLVVVQQVGKRLHGIAPSLRPRAPIGWPAVMGRKARACKSAR